MPFMQVAVTYISILIINWLDVNPNNIFISHVDGSIPVAKLGDLGNRKCFSWPYVCSPL
jgi:hypothetical protein